jgi:hypothetical protein
MNKKLATTFEIEMIELVNVEGEELHQFEAQQNGVTF